MLFLYNLITWTFDTYLRHILYAHLTNLLLFNRQIKVNIQIGNSKISCTKDFLVDVGKSLNDTTAANLLCDLALTAEQFICYSFGLHVTYIFWGLPAKIQPRV